MWKKVENMFEGLSKTTIAHYVFAITFVFVFSFTVFFPLMKDIPKKNELNVDWGTVTYKSVSRKGYMPGLKKEGGTTYFTCREYPRGRHDCFPIDEYQKISGEPGRVWWYNQVIFPGFTQKRVVYMEVDGKEIVNRKMVKEDVEFSKTWMFFTVVAMFLLAFYLIFRDAKRRKSKKYYAFK